MLFSILKRMINKIKPLLIFLLIVLIGLFLYFNINKQVDVKEEKNKISSFIESTSIIENKDISNNTDKEIKKLNINNDYIGILEIPSINFKKGFFKVGSTNNTVDVGLQMLEGSQLPDVENSQLAIAGHSGTGKLAYFEELDHLKKDNDIYVFYNGNKYIYKVYKVFITPKDGNLNIESYDGINSLVLTTCKPTNPKKEQLSILAYLVDTNKY